MIPDIARFVFSQSCVSSSFLGLTWCVYDKDHMSALRIKNTSESDPRSYEVTQAVTNKAQKTI